jgi:DNA adenine methylase
VTIAPPIKYHGGKHYLAKRIVELMPPHTHYVEPFAGGLSVLLAKDPEGVSEVVNDVYGDLTVFWRVLADPVWFAEFQRIIQATPFSEWHWQSAHRFDPAACASSVTQAVAFFVLARQSHAGRMDGFAALSRNRTRRGMNEQASAWLSAVEGLPEVHARLRRVVILNRDAAAVIRGQDGPKTLFYCDPPYLHETRAVTDAYRHEMTNEDHRNLLAALLECEGRVMLSGYPNGLYDETLKGWSRVDWGHPQPRGGRGDQAGDDRVPLVQLGGGSSMKALPDRDVPREGEAELLEANRGLVWAQVVRLSPSQIRRIGSQEDAVQWGMLGLLRAIRGHEPGKAALTTYAVPWIKKYLLAALRRAGFIRVPDYQNGKVGERVVPVNQRPRQGPVGPEALRPRRGHPPVRAGPDLRPGGHPGCRPVPPAPAHTQSARAGRRALPARAERPRAGAQGRPLHAGGLLEAQAGPGEATPPQ